MNLVISNSCNLIGIVFSIIGAFMMYKNTPKVNSNNIVFSKKEAEKKQAIDMAKNKKIRRGMFLLFISFTFQLIPLVSYFMSFFKL